MSAFLTRLSTAVMDASKGTFCCGGKIRLKAPIKLVCYDKAAVGQSQALIFPLPVPQTEIASLLGICHEASFGKGSEAVLDPTYRSALALSPDCFSSNFSLEEHRVLGTVATLMMPSAAHGGITAELYKLNVYRPGDFFRSHVDTPRGSGMFGSLVVCLPQAHTGGQLQVTSVKPNAADAEQHTFDWGAGSNEQLDVQWAAFYSDCPHKILPVESGHRLTLTFNLFAAPAASAHGPLALPALSNDGTALHTLLTAALSDPSFLPDGGMLGFGCQHAYPHTQEGLCDKVQEVLKGGDAAVYAAAHALGLKAEVKAVYDMKDYQERYNESCQYEYGDQPITSDEELLKDHESPFRLIDPHAVIGQDSHCEYSTPRSEILRYYFKGSVPDSNVTWCMPPNRWALQMLFAAHGNEPSASDWYTAAAVLVTVPKWGSQQRAPALPGKQA